MGGNVVDDYEEVYVERRTRRVQVTEERGGTVTAWHGGREIASLGGWTTVGAAMRDSREQAERYAVGPGSTLAIRVCEVVTRYWGCPDERDRSANREKVVARRHVHDAVLGDLPAEPVTVRFTIRKWLGLPEGTDPAPYLACYSDVAVEAISADALFEGYGHGAIAHSAPAVVPAETAAPRPDRGHSYLRVAIEGTLVVMVPPGGDAERLMDGRIAVDVVHDFRAIQGIDGVRPAFQSDMGNTGFSHAVVPA